MKIIDRKTLEQKDLNDLKAFTELEYYVIRKAGCQEFECSDMGDNQYPVCIYSWDFAVCPVVKLIFRLYRITEKAKKWK